MGWSQLLNARAKLSDTELSLCHVYKAFWFGEPILRFFLSRLRFDPIEKATSQTIFAHIKNNPLRSIATAIESQYANQIQCTHAAASPNLCVNGGPLIESKSNQHNCELLKIFTLLKWMRRARPQPAILLRPRICFTTKTVNLITIPSAQFINHMQAVRCYLKQHRRRGHCMQNVHQ